jgi:transcriptional regulator with XRE-family HTH domain
MEIAEFNALVTRLRDASAERRDDHRDEPDATPGREPRSAPLSYPAAYPPEGITTPGEWLRAIRAARRWSRRDLSRQIGVNRDVVARWESGEAPLCRQRVIAHLNEIAGHLGLPPCPETEPQPRRTRERARPRRRDALSRSTPRSALRP